MQTLEREDMTARQIIIKCLDENTDVTCRKYSCGEPEKEGNSGRCCHKCSLEILKEHENKIYNKAIDDLLKQVRFEEKWLFDTGMRSQDVNIAFSGIYMEAKRLKQTKTV